MKNKVLESSVEEIVFVYANPIEKNWFPAKAKIIEVLMNCKNGKRYCKVEILESGKVCNLFC